MIDALSAVAQNRVHVIIILHRIKILAVNADALSHAVVMDIQKEIMMIRILIEILEIINYIRILNQRSLLCRISI